jgi:hypothetical protein
VKREQKDLLLARLSSESKHSRARGCRERKELVLHRRIIVYISLSFSGAFSSRVPPAVRSGPSRAQNRVYRFVSGDAFCVFLIAFAITPRREIGSSRDRSRRACRLLWDFSTDRRDANASILISTRATRATTALLHRRSNFRLGTPGFAALSMSPIDGSARYLPAPSRPGLKLDGTVRSPARKGPACFVVGRRLIAPCSIRSTSCFSDSSQMRISPLT